MRVRVLRQAGSTHDAMARRPSLLIERIDLESRKTAIGISHIVNMISISDLKKEQRGGPSDAWTDVVRDVLTFGS